MKLIIGNKRVSSWSLRPWLVLSHFQIPFEEILIYLDQPETTKNILRYSPTAKVPVLIDGDLVIWDSLAICEYVHENFPEKNLWPKDTARRAHARSVTAEMHSGFQVMREVMSHDLQTQHTSFSSEKAQKDIDRVKEIWLQCLRTYGGPFLFGDFSIADAFYAPVVNRFISYAVPVTEPELRSYMTLIRQNSSHQDWIKAGLAETAELPFH